MDQVVQGGKVYIGARVSARSRGEVPVGDRGQHASNHGTILSAHEDDAR